VAKIVIVPKSQGLVMKSYARKLLETRRSSMFTHAFNMGVK